MKSMYIGAFLGAVFSLFAVSVPVIHARIIPGVDEPFDPANYYSMTTVSYADSPSPFAIRELLGGQISGTVQANSANKILNNISAVLTSKEFSTAVQLAKAAQRSGGDARKFLNYMRDTIAPAIKQGTASLGLGQNEQKLLDDLIDESFNFSSSKDLGDFAKKVAQREVEKAVKDELRKTLTKTGNGYATVIVAGGIGGNGNIDIDMGAEGVGADVYDYLKEVQEILESQRTQELLESLGIKTNELNIILAKLPSAAAQRIDINREKIRTKTIELSKDESILNAEKIFGKGVYERELEMWTGDTVPEYYTTTYAEKVGAIQNEYMKIAERVKLNQDDLETQYAALNEIMALNEAAEGEMEAIEINNKAKALQTEIINRQNLIASQLVQLRAIKQRWQAAQDEVTRLAVHGFAHYAQIADPFDPKEQERLKELGYKRHSVGAMPNFDE